MSASATGDKTDSAFIISESSAGPAAATRARACSNSSSGSGAGAFRRSRSSCRSSSICLRSRSRISAWSCWTTAHEASCLGGAGFGGGALLCSSSRTTFRIWALIWATYWSSSPRVIGSLSLLMASALSWGNVSDTFLACTGTQTGTQVRTKRGLLKAR